MNEIGREDEKSHSDFLSSVLLYGRFLAVITLVFMYTGFGCMGARVDHRGEAIPEWALTGNAPETQGSICAVAVAGPTYFRTDGVEAASERARSALAKTLEVEIRSNMVDLQTHDASAHEYQSIVEVSTFASELVLHGAEIVEIWYDEKGIGFGQKPRCIYVLACMDSGSLPASLSGE